MSVRQRGILLMKEQLDLTSPEHRRHPGIIGAARVLDTVSLLGMRAPDGPELAAANRFDLDGPGTVARWLGLDYAASPLPDIRAAWQGTCEFVTPNGRKRLLPQ